MTAAPFVRWTACLLALECGIALFALGQSRESAPQQTEQPNTIEPDLRLSSAPQKLPFLRSFVRDEWTLWSSPFRPGNYGSHTVKKYVVPFALISAGLIATDSKTANVLPNTTDQEIWSGRVSRIGGSYSLAAFSGVVFLVGKASGNKHAVETGWLSLHALGHSQIIVHGLKLATQRDRPLTDESRSGFFRGGNSFPSGHATSSFSVATVFAYEYREHIAVPITAYALAGVVSASRVSARKHWVSDIFVGGSLGFLIGRFVYKTHHNPDLPGSPVSTPSRFIPTLGFGGRSAVLEWRL
jgi:membrane-associated phospholipid phosphatase